MTKEQLIKEFREKFFTVHDGCDDGYYACPKSEDYFGKYESTPIEERPCFCHVEYTKPKVEAFLLSAFDAGRASGIEEVKEKDCVCNDDRAGGSFAHGHFDNCPRFPQAFQKSKWEDKITQILQEEIADRVGYQDKFSELALKRGLQSAETRLQVYVTSILTPSSSKDN